MSRITARLAPLAPLVALGLLLAAPLTLARTWYINPGGTGDAPTIRAGTDSASAGDTVLVAAGFHSDGGVLKSGVAIIGESGPEATIVESPDRGTLFVADGHTDVYGALIEGLTLRGATTGYGISAAVVANGSIEVRDCVVRGHSSRGTPAIAVDGDLFLEGCTIADNHVSWCIPDVGGVGFRGRGTGVLRMTDCVVENCTDPAVRVLDGHLELTNSVIRDCGWNGAIQIGESYGPPLASARIENNLFWRNDHSIVVCQEDGTDVEIRGNTFAKGLDWGLGPYLGRGATVEANLITGALRGGLFLCNACPDVQVLCNDSWGNHGPNWFNFPDPTGIDGNISEPPKYCAPDVDDFTLAGNSPCLPAHNSCGVRIGAFEEGCGPVSVTEESWGRIKAAYRAGTVR